MIGQQRIRIGVSSCLLGAEVRFDGRHKRDPFISEILGRHFEFLPICPEVGVGMGVPREPVTLVRFQDGSIQTIGVENSGLNVTGSIRAYSDCVMPELVSLRGYLLKSRSPSCGLRDVPVHAENGGGQIGTGTGLFADSLLSHYPLLPVEQESGLVSPASKEHFIERVFAYDRWLTLVESRPTLARLIDFHTRHKLQILSHHQLTYRRLGRLVAEAASTASLDEVLQSYGRQLTIALAHPASRNDHVNVMQHLLGYMKPVLDHDAKQEFLLAVDAYKARKISLCVPLDLVRHHFSFYPHPFVECQVYLYPGQQESVLRASI